MNSPDPTTFRRVLIIRLSSIGDIVLTTPVLRTLHRKYPHLKIDYMIKEQFRGLVESHPAVDRVRTIDNDFGFRDLLALRKEIQSSGQYDAIIDLHDNLRSRVLTFRSNLPFVRYDKQRFYRWLYVYWKVRTQAVEKYITAKYFEAMAPYNIRDDEEGLDFYFPDDFVFSTPELSTRVMEFHQSGVPVTVAPGAAWQTKEWLPGRFARLMNRLISEKNATIALLGGPSEVQLGEEVLHSVVKPEKVYNFIGQTSLVETAKILEGTRMHLANDSGLTHIATAFKKKVVVILGPTAMPIVFYPKYTDYEIVADTALRCRPCTHMGRKKCPLGHFRCMKNIQVDHVMQACNKLLALS